MKIVMLSGKSSCGKSATLNKVYNTINPNEIDIIQQKRQLGEEKNDFECIIKYNDIIVAFFTMGDYSRNVIEAFEKYDDNCDILVCACNNRFKRPYKRITKYSHFIVNKSISHITNEANDDISNEDDKEKIIDLIKDK